MAFRRIPDLTEPEIDVQMNGIKSHYDVEEDHLETIQRKLLDDYIRGDTKLKSSEFVSDFSMIWHDANGRRPIAR